MPKIPVLKGHSTMSKTKTAKAVTVAPAITVPESVEERATFIENFRRLKTSTALYTQTVEAAKARYATLPTAVKLAYPENAFVNESLKDAGVAGVEVSADADTLAAIEDALIEFGKKQTTKEDLSKVYMATAMRLLGGKPASTSTATAGRACSTSLYLDGVKKSFHEICTELGLTTSGKSTKAGYAWLVNNKHIEASRLEIR